MLLFGCCFKTMAMKLQVPIQEQGYSPEKSQLVVGISLHHAPLCRQQRAVPPHLQLPIQEQGYSL